MSRTSPRYPAEEPVKHDGPQGAEIRLLHPASRMRYFFNLTDGHTMIRDEEGAEVMTIQAAIAHAMNAVEELRAEDPSDVAGWQGWRLEIVDASGAMVQSIPLDIRAVQ